MSINTIFKANDNSGYFIPTESTRVGYNGKSIRTTGERGEGSVTHSQLDSDYTPIHDNVKAILAISSNFANVLPIGEVALKARLKESGDVGLGLAYTGTFGNNVIYGVWTQYKTDTLPYQQYLFVLDIATMTVLS